ncbi:VOC family protein [Aurantiacibacter flavus]|uniref:VOC family protein n=1 Tax=Aurantiacibacter flavus TaxID=3145232 RepID=A0ABV0D2C8_9SPHN
MSAGVVGIDHVQIAMPPGEEDRARGFYADILGLTEVPKPADMAKRGGCWFAGGGAQIHLGVEQGFVPAKKAHPALLVDDLAKFCARLAQAGVTSSEGGPLEGYVRADIHDPFGNRIELMQRLPG